MFAHKDLCVGEQVPAPGVVPVQVGEEHGRDVAHVQPEECEAVAHSSRAPSGVDADQARGRPEYIQVYESVPYRHEPVADRTRIEQAREEPVSDHWGLTTLPTRCASRTIEPR